MSRDNLLLVFDLDETLLHSQEDPLDRPPDFQPCGVYSYIRPGAKQFILDCLAHWTVGVWSSAREDYVEEVVRALFPDPAALAFIFARDRCSSRFDELSGDLLIRKDLKKLTRLGFRLDRILAVDNIVEHYCSSYGNVVPVPTWAGSPLDDDHLPRLFPFLEQWAREPDVRSVEKRYWATHPAGDDS